MGRFLVLVLAEREGATRSQPRQDSREADRRIEMVVGKTRKQILHGTQRLGCPVGLDVYLLGHALSRIYKKDDNQERV